MAFIYNLSVIQIKLIHRPCVYIKHYIVIYNQCGRVHKKYFLLTMTQGLPLYAITDICALNLFNT